MDDFLNCAICLQPYDEALPKMVFDCMHTFCETCLRRDYQQAVRSKDTFKCALCRQSIRLPNGIEGLKTNFTLLYIRDYLHTKTSNVCSVCKAIKKTTKARFTCRDCKIHLCEECTDVHYSKDLFKEHSIFSVEDSAGLCKDHGVNVQFFCNTCKNMLCPLCYQLQPHDTHDVVEFPTFSKTRVEVKQLPVSVDEVAAMDEHVDSLIRQIIEDQSHQLKSELKTDH